LKKLEKIARKKLKAPQKRLHLKPGQVHPDIDTLLNGADNALEDVEWPGDLQGDADVGMSVMLQEIIARRKHDRERYRDLYDDDYYLVVVFQASRQKAQFLQQSAWPVIDKRFVDGLRLAGMLGIEVNEIILELPKQHRKRRFGRKEVLSHA
jgi:ABC-type phosphonate transport system ATPase subunit